MAVLTRLARHANAMFYKERANNEGLWMGLGRTSAWPNDLVPPIPDPSKTVIEQPIGYKKASEVTFVKQDPAGTIEYLGERYTAIDDIEARSLRSTLIYLKFVVEYTELPATTTRQIGIFRGLGLKPEVDPNLQAALPEEVNNVGDLEILDNTMPNTRAEYQRDEYSYMIVF